jgi:hypothetical protein
VAQRRTKHVKAIAHPDSENGAKLGLSELRNIVAPAPNQSEVVTIRLSGAWYTIWQQLKRELPGITDAEILRQAVALRAALVAVDSNGEKPVASITFHDETGKLVTKSLEEHVGIRL